MFGELDVFILNHSNFSSDNIFSNFTKYSRFFLVK